MHMENCVLASLCCGVTYQSWSLLKLPVPLFQTHVTTTVPDRWPQSLWFRLTSGEPVCQNRVGFFCLSLFVLLWLRFCICWHEAID